MPDSPHVSVRGDLSLDDATRSTLTGLSDAGTAAIGELASAAQTRAAADAEARKALSRSLAGKQVTKATRDDKALAAGLTATKAAIAAEDELATARAAALEQARPSGATSSRR